LYLERFRNKYPLFNDDIQGTGAVVLSGFLNAAKLSSAASGRPLNSHRILFFGAGSAGVGVAMQLMSYFTLQGLSVEEARERIWLVDSQGLVFDARGRLPEHKKCWYRYKLLHIRAPFTHPCDRFLPSRLQGASSDWYSRYYRLRQANGITGSVDNHGEILYSVVGSVPVLTRITGCIRSRCYRSHGCPEPQTNHIPPLEPR